MVEPGPIKMPPPPRKSQPRRTWLALLFSPRKWPGWGTIGLGAARIFHLGEDIDFAINMVRSLGGDLGSIATAIASPFFAIALIGYGVVHLIFVGEPRRAVRGRAWIYVGWAIFGLCFTAVAVTAIWGALEIYIREQIASRQATILHDGLSPRAQPQPPDPAFSFQRRLSPDQFRQFVQQAAKLKPEISSVLLTIAPGDNEAWALRKDLSDALYGPAYLRLTAQ